MVSFSISTSETGNVVVARLNLREGGLDDLVVEGEVSEEVYMGVVWGREEVIGFILTERGIGTSLLGEPTRGTGDLNLEDSPSLAFFAFLDFSEGSRILFMKLGGCSGSQSTVKSLISTP